jgi:phage shock protein A
MDPSGVLLALEEQRKWRERRKRIWDRLRQVERRKMTLRRELEEVRRKILEYDRLLTDLTGEVQTRSASSHVSPIPRGR